MKRLFSVFSLLLAAFTGAFAQDGGSEALGFCRIEYDPVYAGMAGASAVSTTSGAYAAFGNVAMLPLSERKFDFAASYQGWMPSVYKGNDVSLGIAGRAGRVGLALAAAYNFFPEQPEFGIREQDLLVGLGVSVKIVDAFSIGVNGRYARQMLSSEYSYGAFMGDFYISGKVKGFGYAAGVSSLGGNVVSGGSSYRLPASARLGLGYDATFAQKHSLQVNVDGDYFIFSRAYSVAAGLQYGFADIVFIRAGYRYGGVSVIPSYASVGIGFNIKGFHIDGSYRINGDLRNTFSAGLGYRF